MNLNNLATSCLLCFPTGLGDNGKNFLFSQEGDYHRYISLRETAVLFC
uniref:Uncharacterized protein n=1 Tax=Anguilla anguilla TaxID=7936 RepID=A0A0E9QGC5_ANGAN